MGTRIGELHAALEVPYTSTGTLQVPYMDLAGSGIGPNLRESVPQTPMIPEVLLVFCTCPDEETGERIAETLVVERLAACVNRLPTLTSVYLWESQVERDRETLLLIKTTSARFDALRARLCELHPYELPEIIATPVTKGLPEYLQWVSTCTAADT